LLVKDERVVGIEPWEEFPFNQGKLCPKGIKRYLQNNHPDRLLHPLVRTGRGFGRIPWDEALDLVAERIGRLQARYGRDSVAVLSGASLTNEKAYLMGKFARLAVGTRHVDYNGRLCMVAAGAGNLRAFGIDRAANPWADTWSSGIRRASTRCEPSSNATRPRPWSGWWASPRDASSRRPSCGCRRRAPCCSTRAASSTTPRASRTCSPASTSCSPPARS